MGIHTMRHSVKDPFKAPKAHKQPRKLTEYEIARQEAERELREYEAEQERERIAAQVKASVIRQPRQNITLVKM
jgi:uncharacterized membrane protein